MYYNAEYWRLEMKFQLQLITEMISCLQQPEHQTLHLKHYTLNP